jgi:hypothetical protein
MAASAAGKRRISRMHKREIEKLLERAVAEALGVELKARRRTQNKVTQIAAFKKARADHRAAA